MRAVVFVLLFGVLGCGQKKEDPIPYKGEGGDTDEKRLRAEYARWLDLKDKASKLQDEGLKEMAEAREKRQRGGLPELPPDQEPRPASEKPWQELRNQIKALREEYGNRWRSLGLEVK